MNTYFVFTPDLSHVANGSFSECQMLADQLTRGDDFPLLKIARIRAGEPEATIIFDISEDSRKQSGRVRRINRHKLIQGAKQRPFPQ